MKMTRTLPTIITTVLLGCNPEEANISIPKKIEHQQSVEIAQEVKQEVNQTEYTTPKSGNLEYDLVSRADEGTTLDIQHAAKARKIAEYVINKNKQRGLLAYDSNHNGGANDYQGVQTVMIIGKDKYTIWIANDDETKDQLSRDMLSVWIRPGNKPGRDNIIAFSDIGFDGNCDFYIDATVKTRGNKEPIIFEGLSGPKQQRGLEHQDTAQKVYESTLDKIIRFYERS